MVNFYVEISKREVMEQEPTTPQLHDSQHALPGSPPDAHNDGDVEMTDGNSPIAPSVSPLTPNFPPTYPHAVGQPSDNEIGDEPLDPTGTSQAIEPPTLTESHALAKNLQSPRVVEDGVLSHPKSIISTIEEPHARINAPALDTEAPGPLLSETSATENPPEPPSQNGTSRATSAQPTSAPSPALPTKAVPNGAPARRYLNEKVTGVLLEGMKRLARDQPPNPLKVLGDYLLSESVKFESELEVA